MGPHRRLGIYVGVYSPLMIRYLEPMTRDVFTTHFRDCQFNETIFLPLGGDKIVPEERIVLIEKPVPEEWQELT